MKLTLLLLFSILGGSVGCVSSMTEEERYERQDKLNLAKEEFQERAASCREQGGVIQLKGCMIGRGSGIHRCTAIDYKMASCVSFYD